MFWIVDRFPSNQYFYVHTTKTVHLQFYAVLFK